MFTRKLLCLLLAMGCVAGAAHGALAAEVACDSVYCFTDADFTTDEKTPLEGICVLSLPDSSAGTVMLGARVVQPGDILTARQVAKLTFVPLQTEEDAAASMTYLPVYRDYVAASATMTISIRGKEDKAPVAEDLALETYKNLPNDGALKVKDPEGQPMTYTVTRQPRRGDVVIREDGSFTYTPKKNKVGTDSFTYTATDPAGNVSREATVTIQILKPTTAAQYSDTAGADYRFEAEWMKNTGIFTGETLGDNACFQPEKAVTAGEFLTMLLRALEIPTDREVYAAIDPDTPVWLKPYLAAAVRSGLTAGLPADLSPNASITEGQAAVILQNALDLPISASAAADRGKSDVPAWADTAVQALGENGISLETDAVLTRAQAAVILYRASILAEDAPGMIMLRAQ